MPPNAARPPDLTSMIGQDDVRHQLDLTIRGSQARSAQPPHILLTGPAGHGKTSLARIAAAELNATLVTTSGPALRHPSDLAGILADLTENGVLFIDEIHRLSKHTEEALYEFMEDGTLSVVIGSGQSARTMTLEMPPTTVIGATTLPGSMSTPFRDRFGLHLEVRSYTPLELKEIITTHNTDIPTEAAYEIALRSRGVPRLAKHLADRCADVHAVKDHLPFDEKFAAAALDIFGVFHDGLTHADYRILTILTQDFRFRAIGIQALSSALNMDPSTIREQHEPFLVRQGLVTRTPSGRMATQDAYRFLKQHPEPIS